ncbi:Importin beta-like SAD2 [Zea mays]|uniref:Importin beta-like SAD2 n=1 Tax=Zea mays TaxID=4577 RepID=A0A3L6EX78_MAIZE|nr:Importin beta-like SAD2 [Zea mays]
MDIETHAAALARDELRRLLAATLSPDKASVDAAAAGLDALSSDPRFPLAILAVAAGDGDQGMRVAAATYLKNFTRRNLETRLCSSEVYKEFRDQLAQALLRVEPAILRVLIEVLKLVIQSSNLISPGQHPECNTINALTVLQSVVRPFQYFLNPKVVKEPVPQQLEQIAAEILVPLQVTFHHFSDKVLLSPDGTNLEYEQLLLITCKCMYFTVRSYMPSRVKQILPSFCKDMFRILDSLNFNSLIEDGSTMKLKIAKRCLIIFCALVTRHRKHTDNQMPHIVNCAIKISKQSIHLSKLDSLPNRIVSLAFDVISRVLETGPGWRLVSPHFSSLLDSAIFPALALNEKDIEEWEEDTDEYMQKNLPSELDDISGWTEDLFTARKSAINLLGVIALSKGPPVASAASKRKKGDKNKGKSEMSSIGELLVTPFLSKFPIPSHGEDASSVALFRCFDGIWSLQDEPDSPIIFFGSLQPILISTANWVIGQLAICLPEDMSSSIYESLMKALTMEYVEDITCYPVCASASGAIAELIENSYVPPDWLILLQVVLKRISTGDENESALLFKLLGTIVEGGQEKVLSHIPEIVSNIASTVMELLPPVPDPWPQVVEQGFAALVAMVQAWESSAPDENKTPEKRFWQSGQSAIAQTISLLLQKAWLLQADNMEGSALPPPSCVNDASVLLEFVMSSVTCMEETANLKVFELVATWADAIANWDSWEEMEDQGVFNTIKEAVNFHQRFDLDGLFLKTLPSQSENGSQSSVIGRVSNFVTRAIAAYPSATWRACSCVHTLLHAPKFSLGAQDTRKTISESFAQAAFSRFKSVSDSPAGLWKPLLLAISSCYICYPDAIEQVLNNVDGNGFAIWASALAQVSSSLFNPGLSSESEIKLAVLTLSTVINHLVSLSTGGTKLLQDCYASLMESCIQLKEVQDDGDNDDDDDGAEDVDDNDEEEDTEDDDEDSDDDDDAREETEEEFLERYALAAAAGESVEEGDIDEETQDIELGSLDDVDIQQVVIPLMQKLPALQPAGAFPDSLVERIAETFPEYEQFLQALRRA